jgi:5-methylcytosine-specific restriction endonuclease McrA
MSDPRPNWRERGYDATYDANRKLVVRHETHCWVCGELVDKTLSGRHPDGPTIDHVIARSRGGTNDISNLRLAHQRCNNARQAGRRLTRRRPPNRHPGIIEPSEAA